MLIFKNTEYKKLHDMNNIKKGSYLLYWWPETSSVCEECLKGQRQGRYNGSGTDDSDCFSMSNHYLEGEQGDDKGSPNKRKMYF